MDTRLFDAAMTGNVENLLNMINNDPLMLHAVPLAGAETPLHIACMTGHLDFVKEIMKFRREFVEELNQDGLSPLHIASACGHTEIVKELLEAGGTNLCLIKGRERRIALHYSVIKGKVQIIKELLSANIDSVAEVTTRGETALHLAVKNSQFESFRVMVEHLKEFNKEDVLNIKDDSGNTILHLAVSRKQYEHCPCVSVDAKRTLVALFPKDYQACRHQVVRIQARFAKLVDLICFFASRAKRGKHVQVVDLVLNRDLISRSVVEVNSLNQRGLTPMDVSLLFQSEAGDREMEEILQRAGAMRSGELHSLAQTTVHDQINAGNNPSNNQSITEPSRATFGRLIPNIKDSSTQEATALLAIALFMANTSYQSMLSPPGGVWQDDEFGNNFSSDTKTTIPHIAGQAVMSYHSPHSYAVFLMFSIFGFAYSTFMIIVLTDGVYMHWALKISVAALVAAYCRGLDAVASQASRATLGILGNLLGSIDIVLLSILYLKWRARNALSLKDQVRAITEGLVQRLQIWTFLLNDFLATLRRPEQMVEP